MTYSTRVTLTEQFQSAPLTDVRGDSAIVGGDVKRSKFQSAPLTDVRGDKKIFNWPAVDGGFNPLPSRM